MEQGDWPSLCPIWVGSPAHFFMYVTGCLEPCAGKVASGDRLREDN